MRAQQFLIFLQQNYAGWQRAAGLANNQNIQGGWEAWLQVEIALTVVQANNQLVCQREAPYLTGNLDSPFIGYTGGPNPLARAVANQNNAARCDFYLYRPDGVSIQDNTYVELKCINPNSFAPLDDAWNRFRNDITKIKTISNVNQALPGIALLATFGTFNAPLPLFPAGVSAYVWDPNNNNVSTMADVIQDGNARFFLVAASVNT
jgi:hypothetical protein